jgi:putative component of toxin-antitoxin plasmid stabilization module
MGQNRTCRFNPRNGHEIGGLSRLISGEEFDKHTQAFQQRVVKQELRVRLNALERSKLEDKQAVLQALREMIAHVEVTFS